MAITVTNVIGAAGVSYNQVTGIASFSGVTPSLVVGGTDFGHDRLT